MVTLETDIMGFLLFYRLNRVLAGWEREVSVKSHERSQNSAGCATL
jgi:hypothetical protein